MLDIERYLARIGYTGPRDPTLATLRALHQAHLWAVPFENLDIGAGRPIVLDEAAVLAKIVERRRGGFCYELNGAFAALLRALGFRVTLLSAQVQRPPTAAGPAFGPEFDHLTLRVDLEEPWLADVGFGDSFLQPLRLTAWAEQVDTGRSSPIVNQAPEGVWQDRYRLVPDGALWTLQRRDWAGQWQDRYRFTLAPRAWADFAEMCRYHQTDLASIFTRHRTCSLATPSGRVTLSDARLIVTADGARREVALADEAAWAAALAEHFGIVLDGGCAEPPSP